MIAKRTVSIESVIATVRGHWVILSVDLARIHRVDTRVLNQVVKRNLEKFPGDFMFRLTRDEAETLSRSRLQSVILKRGRFSLMNGTR
jgi:ORF6N domain-containing protein